MNVTPEVSVRAMDRRRSLPPGAVWGSWEAVDGWRMRTVHWPARNASSPCLLFLGGRADFIEKYAEAYWRWREAGYGLAAFDWRGQGLSGRFPAGQGGIFATWLEDLDGLCDWAARVLGRDLTIAGHSMGGHLALRYLSAAGKGRFERAIALSPMISIRRAPMSSPALYWLARLRVALGLGDRYPPSQGPYGKAQRSRRRQMLLTGDAGRFGDEAWWIGEAPALALGGVTWRWLAESIASCRALAAGGVPESIETPTLFLIGMNENLVDFAAAQRFAERMPRAIWHPLEAAAHELLREATEVQDIVHAAIRRFVESASG